MVACAVALLYAVTERWLPLAFIRQRSARRAGGENSFASYSAAGFGDGGARLPDVSPSLAPRSGLTKSWQWRF